MTLAFSGATVFSAPTSSTISSTLPVQVTKPLSLNVSKPQRLEVEGLFALASWPR